MQKRFPVLLAGALVSAALATARAEAQAKKGAGPKRPSAKGESLKPPPLPVPNTPVKRPSYMPKLAQLAEEHNGIIRKVKGDLEVREIEYKNAKLRLLPELNFETREALVGQEPNNRAKAPDGSPNPFDSSFYISLHHKLFDPDNNLNFSKLDIARATYERAKLEYEQIRDEQLLRVAEAYYEWSTVKELREIEENKRDLLRRQYNILNAQYKQGLKTKRDVLRIETEIRRLEIDILRRDNEVEIDFGRVASAVGMTAADLDASGIESEQAKPFAVVQPKAPELKVENHRRAQIYRFRNQEMAGETQLWRNNYYPRLTWESEVKYESANYLNSGRSIDDNHLWTYQTALVLHYNLWDFGVSRRNLEAAHIREASVAAENEQALKDLAVDLREVYLRLNEFAENVGASRELLVLEQQSYSVLESEYRNGRAAYLDLITNLNSLIDARSRFMTSYFGYKKQLMKYSLHKGTLHEDIQKQ